MSDVHSISELASQPTGRPAHIVNATNPPQRMTEIFFGASPRLRWDCRDNGVSGLMCPGVSGPEGSLDD